MSFKMKGFCYPGKSPLKQKYDWRNATMTESNYAKFQRRGLKKDVVGPAVDSRKEKTPREQERQGWDDLKKWSIDLQKQQTEKKVKTAYSTLKKSPVKKKWIQKAFKSVERRGTKGVCTGDKFGGPSCPPGTKRYNMAKTLRRMAKK